MRPAEASSEKEEKVGKWDWRHNPFSGTREFNGLRVMMALISNWDLKAKNNAIYSDKEHPGGDYMVSDLGATFGTSGKALIGPVEEQYQGLSEHQFVSKVPADYVNFNFPTRPAFIHFFESVLLGASPVRWIGRHIPRDDARWMGSLLAQLSPEQIRDAFRAAGYPPDQMEECAEQSNRGSPL